MSTPMSARLLSAAALAALIAQPGWTQEAPAEPTETTTETPAPDAPTETPAPDAPTEPDAPAVDDSATGAAVPADDEPPAGGTATAPAEGEAAPAEGEVAPAEGEVAPAEGEVAPAEGEAAAPAPPEVLEVVRETHGEWEVRCLPDGNECFLYQLALDADANPVAEFSLVTLPADSEAMAGVTVVTPLGTLLPAGLVVQVDGGEARRYDFTFCSQVGCFARFGVDDATVAALKRGQAATLQLVSIGAPDQPVDLEVSLEGFTAAYDSLGIPEAPAEPQQ
jgi:invasion protein IalB